MAGFTQTQRLGRDGASRSGAEARLPLSSALAVFLCGVVAGVAAMTINLDVFAAAAVILLVLAAAVAILNRVAERTDERLLAGDASYRAFFEHAIEGIFRTTPDGHYLDANDALARIYGYASPAALKKGLTNIASQLYVDPTRRDAFKALMQAHDQVTSFVSQIRRCDGKVIWISENARAVRDWSGRVVCYEGMVEDVTAKFESERVMREGLRRAEEANRAKSAFLAAMSHELKTPLNAVIGFSEIIKNELFGPAGQPAYPAYAADIHASGTKLLSIINDVLDVSRLEGGALTIDPRACDVRDLADSAIDAARRLVGDDRHVPIDIVGTLPAIHVDPGRLRQAMTNILANALKFTPHNGSVSVRIWVEKSGGVSIAVVDTGIGMAPGKVAAALEPFRQIDGSLARRFEGAGLGLSIAKALVELHGGTLAIESELSRGTTVAIALPGARTRLRDMSAVA
ncbi:MAG: PAS domain S-box protein [Alphaproteobacteria bacterium]|nr:PAS domain S-box protein [Alphaproteobacteria bacterium]